MPRIRAGSSGKLRVENLGDPGPSSGGKRARMQKTPAEDAPEEIGGQEEPPASGRQSPDENAQPRNGAAKQRASQKPAGEAAVHTLTFSAIPSFCVWNDLIGVNQ